MNETNQTQTTMQIKTNDGNYDVASKGLGNTALGLGIAGLATSLLGGSASLLGMGRNNGMTANPTDPDARFVTKSETNLIQENSTLKTELAIQKSENYTDKKLVEVTQYLDTKSKWMPTRMRSKPSTHSRWHTMRQLTPASTCSSRRWHLCRA